MKLLNRKGYPLKDYSHNLYIISSRIGGIKIISSKSIKRVQIFRKIYIIARYFHEY